LISSFIKIVRNSKTEIPGLDLSSQDNKKPGNKKSPLPLRGCHPKGGTKFMI